MYMVVRSNLKNKRNIFLESLRFLTLLLTVATVQDLMVIIKGATMDMPVGDNRPEPAKNVLGEPMVICCEDPLTGFYRNGKCDTGPDDHGLHTVCVQATSEFLEYSKSVGNDLSTPMTEFGFPGLKDGDRWCLCLSRWKQAYDAGKAPRVYLASTHEASLELVPLEVFLEYAIDVN